MTSDFEPVAKTPQEKTDYWLRCALETGDPNWKAAYIQKALETVLTYTDRGLPKIREALNK